MKRDQLVKQLEDMLLSGKDPFVIAEDLADFIEEGFKPKKTAANQEIVEDTERWIGEWIELFPSGVKGGTKLLRSDKKTCLAKMIRFRQDYPEHSIDSIFKATQRYINEQAEKDFAYTTPAINFINHRDKGSELAARCQDLTVKKNIKSESSVNTEKLSSFFG